jgi:hypothetical protein
MCFIFVEILGFYLFVKVGEKTTSDMVQSIFVEHDRTYPTWDRSQTRVSRRPSCALGVGTQRTKRLEHVLYIC